MRDDAKTLPQNKMFKSPIGQYFVKPEVKKGFMPLLIEELIKARNKAKNELDRLSDPF